MAGYGIKKPRNMLENPVYPEYKQGPIRFKSAGKYWKVGPEAMRETETMPHFFSDAILQQPYNYNITRYGQSSFKQIVNSEFRPPVIDPILDTVPLSRMPRRPVFPRMNPDPAGSGHYSTPLLQSNGVQGHLTNAVRFGQLACSPESPWIGHETPIDIETFIPDAEKSTSSHSSDDVSYETPIDDDSDINATTSLEGFATRRRYHDPHAPIKKAPMKKKTVYRF